MRVQKPYFAGRILFRVSEAGEPGTVKQQDAVDIGLALKRLAEEESFMVWQTDENQGARCLDFGEDSLLKSVATLALERRGYQAGRDFEVLA